MIKPTLLFGTSLFFLAAMHAASGGGVAVTIVNVGFSGTEASGGGSTIEGSFEYKKTHPTDFSMGKAVKGSFTFTGSPDHHKLRYTITRANGTTETQPLVTMNPYKITTNSDPTLKKFKLTAKAAPATTNNIILDTNAITDQLHLPDCSLLTAGRTGTFVRMVNGAAAETFDIKIDSCN